MGAASAVAASVTEAGYFAAAGSVAFVLWALTRGRRFTAGPANWITLGRVALTTFLAGFGVHLPWYVAVAIISTCLILDGVDGWLARKTKTTSKLGATYDMESDAYLVMTASLVLYTRGLVGPWGLIAGWWRYAYALLVIVLPSAGEVPRSNFARYVYIALMTALITAFTLPTIAGPVIAIGTVLVSLSFLRSLSWSFRS